MSSGTGVPLDRAWTVARLILDTLEPVTVRAVVAGSLRRGRRTVGDVEIVCEPRTHVVDLFGGEGPDSEAVRNALEALGPLGKAGAKYVKITDVNATGIAADVFIVTPPAEWGSILAIRTGPAELGAWAMAKLRRRGLRHVEGHVEREDDGTIIPTPEEVDFFRLAGLPCLPPEERDSREARLPALGGE